MNLRSKKSSEKRRWSKNVILHLFFFFFGKGWGEWDWKNIDKISQVINKVLSKALTEMLPSKTGVIMDLENSSFIEGGKKKHS